MTSNRQVLEYLKSLQLHPSIIPNRNRKNETCTRCYVDVGNSNMSLSDRRCTLRNAIRCSLSRLHHRSKLYEKVSRNGLGRIIDPRGMTIESALTHDAQIRLLHRYQSLFHDKASEDAFDRAVFDKVVQLALPIIRISTVTPNMKRSFRERIASIAPEILQFIRNRIPPPLPPPPPPPPLPRAQQQQVRRQSSLQPPSRSSSLPGGTQYTLLQTNNNNRNNNSNSVTYYNADDTIYDSNNSNSVTYHNAVEKIRRKRKKNPRRGQ